MRIKETKIYKYDELSDSAKEKAREWMSKHALEYEWWEFIYEDAARIGLKITEFDLDRNRYAKGALTASVKDVCANILKEHGDSCDTYKLAKEFKFCECEDQGNHCEHEEEFERALLEEYSVILQKEYEYRLSDETLEEDIRANEYEFDETGRRA